MTQGAFQCSICGNGTNKLVFKDYRNKDRFPEGVFSMCPSCYTQGDHVEKAPNLRMSAMDGNFKPHYDGQLGKFFQSADEKRKHLASKGYVQTSGMPTPSDCRGSPHCTHGQYERAKRLRQL